jgi:hypothetical protein
VFQAARRAQGAKPGWLRKGAQSTGQQKQLDVGSRQGPPEDMH